MEYDEIKKAKIEDLYPDEHYSIPFTFQELFQVYEIMLTENYNLATKIASYLNEEYDINIDYLYFFHK